MEEDDNTARKRQFAMLCQKLNKIKKSLNEDDTNNINQVIGSNSPASCHSYMMDFEKKADPLVDHNHLMRLIDHYSRVFSNMPLDKHCQNESYARMLVRFAELKAIQDVDEAESNFNVATSHSQNFAFVHIAHAQFEHSQGNTKKAISILLNAVELGAGPKDLLDAALCKMQRGQNQVSSDEKDHFSDKPSLYSNTAVDDSVKKADVGQKGRTTSDGSGDLHLSFSLGSESIGSTDEEPSSGWKSVSQRARIVGLPGRVPVVPFSIPEMDDDDGEYIHKMPSNKADASVPSSSSRQTSGSSMRSMFKTPSSKKPAADKDFGVFQLPNLSAEESPWKDQCTVDSTTKLLHSWQTKDTFSVEDLTYNFDQAVNSKSPESCWASLMDLEKRGNPHTDINLLNKLKDCYSKVFSRMPMTKFNKNSCYAKIMVRYAELKGIEDPEEAKDNFIMARTNCKGFAFVHIAHAQFEISQGNVMKATSILHKAVALNAKPAELLEMALHNLKTGEKLLLPSKDHPTTEPRVVPETCGSTQEGQLPCRVPVSKVLDLQPKPASREHLSEWKLPAPVKYVSPEEKLPKPYESRPPLRVLSCVTTPSQYQPSRANPHIYQTPNNYGNPYGSSSITPVVKVGPAHSSSARAAHPAGPAQQPCPPVQDFFSTLSNDTITINGKQYFILKMVGRGGSSKVYQVLDLHKRLYVVKCVCLEEANSQAIEGYKNEMEHLNHLQQYSDQIIKLYDYEITDTCIYMLMECGNLDLNTELRNKKTVDPLERKLYWRNMLEAVQTIHKHGIVHSDLKPANFVIVNTSLKLIDFGIANRIQPDVTSIMKDSQVGTLNYMAPEAIKDPSSQMKGEMYSKISPKGDVWSLGCILYYMTYGKTPFQSITNQITKLHAILDYSHKIDFPEIPDKDLLDVLKRCLVRNPRERISIAELLDHPYLQQKLPASPKPEPCNTDLQKIFADLAALQSPNSIVRAANNLAKMCSSGRKLDVAQCAKSTQL